MIYTADSRNIHSVDEVHSTVCVCLFIVAQQINSPIINKVKDLSFYFGCALFCICYWYN